MIPLEPVLWRYVLAAQGKLCYNAVKSEENCKKATEDFNDATYKVAQGQGYDLPYGCISDKSTIGKHNVYWNPNGVALSNDSNIRPICNPTADGRYPSVYSN